MKENYTKNEVKIICYMFVVGMLIAIIVLLLVAHHLQDFKDFVEQFSFAATLSSIILSVLAIFISMSGEAKTQTIREKIEREADDIERATREIRQEINNLSKKFGDIASKIELNQKNITMDNVSATPKSSQDNTPYTASINNNSEAKEIIITKG